MKRLLSVALALFVFSSLSECLGERIVTLPCKAVRFAVAADNSGLWFSCSPRLSSELEKANKEARSPDWNTRFNDSTQVYWLPTSSDVPIRVKKILSTVEIIPSPRGALALLIVEERG